MYTSVKPGKYVVAVSGGVDSMVLLDMLAGQPGLDLTVAHFEHGIRPDAMDDCRLVQAAAAGYGLPYIYERGALGAGASEATARVARYAFLRRARAAQGARAIITAHHEDDLIETAMLNLLRGTGRRGLSSLRSTTEIIRPLLHTPKAALRAYAVQHAVRWRDDSTNHSDHYLRNYLRQHHMPRLTSGARAAWLACIHHAAILNDEIDESMSGYVQGDRLPRGWFIMLPHDVSCEIMAAWLRARGAAFDRRAVARLVAAAKTLAPGKQASIDKQCHLQAGRTYVAIVAHLSDR